MKDPLLLVLFCLESIRRIEENFSSGKEAVLSSHTLQDAILRNLHVLSETTQRFPEDQKQQFSEVDWRGIAKFRNVLVHEYFILDWEKIWEIIVNDLPVLKNALLVIKTELEKT